MASQDGMDKEVSVDDLPKTGMTSRVTYIMQEVIEQEAHTLNAFYQEVHKLGYNVGHDRGYQVGYDTGWKNGHEKGYTSGYAKALEWANKQPKGEEEVTNENPDK